MVPKCLDRTVGVFHVSIPAEPSLLQEEVQVLMPSCASSSVDLMVAVSCGFTLQICLIIALSYCCRHWRLGFVNGQVSLTWSIGPCTQELYTQCFSQTEKRALLARQRAFGRAMLLCLFFSLFLALKVCHFSAVTTNPM